MKKIILLSAMASSMLLATNGDNLISLGAESRAMGGTGIAMGMGTDSVFKNPAWLADVESTEAMFGATLFMPDVKAKNAAQGSGVEATSKADLSLIPAVAHAGRINEDFAYGVGMFGVSGMGVDYRNEDQTKALGNMRTNFQYMRFVPSLGYKNGDLRLGAGLTLAYGVLDIAAVGPDQNNNMAQRSGGVSDAFGFGTQFGAGYSVTPNVNVGAYYQTEVSTEYKDVYDFSPDGVYEDLKLSQPAEYGVGIAYTNNGLTVTADIKQITWSKADGYDVFGWDDQTVYSVGTAYDVNSALTLRAGYSQADSPLGDGNLPAATVAGVPMSAQQVIGFNVMGFPAISEQHITAGLGYQFSKQIGIDLAYVYSPKETLAVFGNALQTTNEQNSISGALKYKFD
jgi:long-chain fatty acid transport protein